MEIRNLDDLLGYLCAGNKAKYVYFWAHTQHGAEIDQSCLSQWFPASFSHSALEFPTAEHFMMHRKAELFGDSEIAEKILGAETPGEAKALGREVCGFEEAVWAEARSEIVVAGNLAKFSQNSELREYLLATGSRVLVEASPVDPIWGIGMDKASAMDSHPNEWQGLNLLGFALMQVRSELRQSAD